MRIGIDIDEVMVEFLEGFLEFYREKTGREFKKDDFESYSYWENVFPEPGEKIIELVKEFIDSEFFDEIQIVDGAQESIQELGKNYEIVFITSRDLRSKEKTKIFFEKHFPENNFKIIYSGDIHNYQGKNKAGICEENNIEIMIEDNDNYARDCAEKGIKVFLFNKPWNRNCEEHENIIKVKNWGELLKKLK